MALPEDVVPFDAASETPVEEQRSRALLRIQECLRGSRVPRALQLLRSARYGHRGAHAVPGLWERGASLSPRVPREVWPEGDVFGAADAGPPEETQLLREILGASLPGESPHL